VKINVYCDGGARGNPGPAACAFVVYEPKDLHGLVTNFTETDLGAWNIRYKCGKYLGTKTNNEAEYQGVIEALNYLISSVNPFSPINFFLDSSLVVNQINGLFRVKEPRLRELLFKVRELETRLSPTPISYTYVPREQNAEADLLVNETLDSSSVKV